MRDMRFQIMQNRDMSAGIIRVLGAKRISRTGTGASSLIAEHRFCNTDKMDVYIRLNKTVDPDGKKEESKKAVWEKAEEVSVLSVQEQMEEFMFLGLRKTDGVSEKSFFETFGVQIDTVYGETIGKLEKNVF